MTLFQAARIRRLAVVVAAVAALCLSCKNGITPESIRGTDNGGPGSQYGSIAVSSTPPGAEIWLDGANSGFVSDHVFNSLPAGNHSVGLWFSGKLSYDTAVMVAVGATSVVAPVLLPFLAGQWQPGYGAYAVSVAPPYAYLLDDTGMWIVDVSNPESPHPEGHFGCEYSYDVCASGTYAYITKVDSLVVVDVSNPAAPTQVGALCCWPQGGLCVSGSTVYLAADSGTGPPVKRKGQSGLLIVDVSNPAAPTILGCLGGFYADRVCVSGTRLYAVDQEYLLVADVADPHNPYTLGWCLAGSAWDVAVAGSYAYVADYDSGLIVVDVSDPSSPFPTGHTTGLWGEAVCVSAPDTVCLADATCGLRMFDVANPLSPREIGRCETADPSPVDLVTCGQYVYIADYDAGLQVVKVAR